MTHIEVKEIEHTADCRAFSSTGRLKKLIGMTPNICDCGASKFNKKLTKNK